MGARGFFFGGGGGSDSEISMSAKYQHHCKSICNKYILVSSTTGHSGDHDTTSSGGILTSTCTVVTGCCIAIAALVHILRGKLHCGQAKKLYF